MKLFEVKSRKKIIFLFALLVIPLLTVLILVSHASSYSRARLQKRKGERALLKSARKITRNQLQLFRKTLMLAHILNRTPKSKRAQQIFRHLPALSRSLHAAMTEFEKEVAALGFYPIFKGRLHLWKKHTAAFKKEFKKANHALTSSAAWQLHKITNAMVINFMVINDVLDIVKNGVHHPVPLAFVPPARPAYSRKDTNPAHTVWPDRASLLDLLLGKVKGQQFPYKNTIRVPYCLRCHPARKGVGFYWFDRNRKTETFAKKWIAEQKVAVKLKPVHKPVKVSPKPIKVSVKKKPVVIKPKPITHKPVKVAIKHKPIIKKKPVAKKPIQLAFLPPSRIAAIKDELRSTFQTASTAASLHENLLSFTAALSGSTQQTANNLSHYGPNMLKLLTYKIYKLGGLLPQRLNTLNSTMFRLKSQLRELYMTSLFTQKFSVWDQKMKNIKSTDQNFQQIVQQLHPAPSSKSQLSSLLGSASSDLQKIHKDSRVLASEFNLIANVVYILKAVPPSAVVPPPGRVPGLSWSAYHAMTGDILIKNLNNPPHICDRIPSPCNSIYSVKDHNPNHIWWPNQATLKDFLMGRVKGQMWAYKDNPNIPYCQRCHTMREGKPIMWWNSIKTSAAMAAGLGALEKAIKR
jgi:hypothetical protein